MSLRQISKEEVSLNQHMEDLQLRMQMLKSDRKANMDVLEASKASNKDEIRRLRDANKEYRQKLVALQKTARVDDDKDEEKHVQREISRLRKAYDDVRLRSARSNRYLDELRDSAKDLELNSQRPHMEDNEFTRCIRALENKLDKAMIKYNEAQSIRKTYEQIVKRLKEERVGFDNQLTAVERTLGAKMRDYDELLLLGGDANHARDTAYGEKERVLVGYEDERKRREKELRERHQVVQLRKQMLDRMRQREKMRNQLVQVDGDVSEKSMLNTMMFQQQQTTDKIEAQNKVDIFENGFRKIKEATGVSDVNDVIEKITSQESSLENLIAITKENQAKIEGLKDVRRTTKAKVEAVKYSGASGGHRRKLVDDHEDQLANSATRLERSKLKFERLTKVIISMKGGVGHLQEKLGHFGGEGVRTIELGDDTVVEVLRECETSLSNLVRRLEGGGDGRKSRGRTGATDGTSSTASISMHDIGGSEMSEKEGGGGTLDPAERSDSAGGYRQTGNISPSIRPYNQRIDLAMNNEEETDNKNHSNESNSGGDFEDEEITREKVKRASSQILAQVSRKKKPKKKGTVGTGLSEDDM